MTPGRGGRYRAEILPGWPGVGWATAAGLEAATPFQSARWLDGWYAIMAGGGDVTPLPVLVREAGEAGAAVALLPLVLRREAGRRLVEFADRGITDYNAPLLGPGAPADREGGLALWRAVRAALPAADLALLTKMPVEVGGRPNPLALLPGTAASNVFGNVLTIGDDFAAWRRQHLTKHARKELDRSWRVFARHEGASFRRVADPADAGRVFDDLARMQRERIAGSGRPYILDDPDHDRFHRHLVETGLADGSLILAALEAEGQTVAALLGIADGRCFAMTRLSHAGGERWHASSPGRLVIEKTMEHLHGSGCRVFDFTIGDYAHKRRFEVSRVPLVELTSALSARGLPRLGRDRVKAFVKRRPALAQAARRAVATAARVRAVVAGGAAAPSTPGAASPGRMPVPGATQG